MPSNHSPLLFSFSSQESLGCIQGGLGGYPLRARDLKDHGYARTPTANYIASINGNAVFVHESTQESYTSWLDPVRSENAHSR